MDELFSPLFSLLFFLFIFLVLPLRAVKKQTAKQAQTKKKQPSHPAAEQAAEAPSPAPAPAGQPKDEGDSRWEHDHDSWAGSLGALSTEGFDPCHEEQFASAPAPAPTPVPESSGIPGLSIHWTGDEIVRGLVVSEVLKRKDFSRQA